VFFQYTKKIITSIILFIFYFEFGLIFFIIQPIEKEENLKINLPRKPIFRVRDTFQTIITAYSSNVFECDNSPCITANGFNVCEHDVEDTVAINSLKLGTKIRIPSVFGNRVFIVRDRTNKRFQKRLDIWMKNRKDAIKFGVKRANVEIVDVF